MPNLTRFSVGAGTFDPSGSAIAPARSPVPCPLQPILSSIACPKPDAIGVSSIAAAAACSFFGSFFACRDGNGSSCSVEAASAAAGGVFFLGGLLRGLLSP